MINYNPFVKFLSIIIVNNKYENDIRLIQTL